MGNCIFSFTKKRTFEDFEKRLKEAYSYGWVLDLEIRRFESSSYTLKPPHWFECYDWEMTSPDIYVDKNNVVYTVPYWFWNDNVLKTGSID